MARRKDDNAALMNYRPDRKQYTAPDKETILGRVKKAKDLKASVKKQTDDRWSELAQQLDSAYMTNTNTMDHMVSLFTGTHELGLPADQRYVGFDSKSSKAADVIFRVMGMLAVKEKARYIGEDGSQKQRDGLEAIEMHLNAVPPWLFRKYDQRWDLQSLFWQLLVGRSYIQQSYLPFYWDKTIMGRRKTDDGEESDSDYNARVAGYRGHMGPPVFNESLDPRIVFPVRTPMGNEAYVKIFRVSRLEMDASMARAGKQVTLNQKGEVDHVADLEKKRLQELPRQSNSTFPMDGAVDYIEYVDDVYCYYIIGNEIVHDYKHDGGIKIFPAYGLQTGFSDYHLMAMGLLWAVRNEIPQYDFMRTLWAQKAYLDVFRHIFVELDKDTEPLRDKDGQLIEWSVSPGKVTQVRGHVVDPMTNQSAGIDHRGMLQELGGSIDLATISSLARGVAGAQQPGYAINQLSQSMGTLWRPLVQSRQIQLSARHEHYLWVVKNLVQRPVTVFTETGEEDGRRLGQYCTLDPDDIEEFGRVEVDIEPVLPVDEQGAKLTNWKLFQEGGLTWDDWIRDGLKKTNPTSYRKQVDKDSARRAFLPEAMKDAMALGRVKLTNDIAQAHGIDKLNQIGQLDIQALKAARATQQPPADPNAPPPPQVTPAPGTPTGGPPGEASVGPTGPGIQPTAGANPNDSAPGFRGT